MKKSFNIRRGEQVLLVKQDNPDRKEIYKDEIEVIQSIILRLELESNDLKNRLKCISNVEKSEVEKKYKNLKKSIREFSRLLKNLVQESKIKEIKTPKCELMQ